MELVPDQPRDFAQSYCDARCRHDPARVAGRCTFGDDGFVTGSKGKVGHRCHLEHGAPQP